MIIEISTDSKNYKWIIMSDSENEEDFIKNLSVELIDRYMGQIIMFRESKETVIRCTKL